MELSDFLPALKKAFESFLPILWRFGAFMVACWVVGGLIRCRRLFHASAKSVVVKGRFKNK